MLLNNLPAHPAQTPVTKRPRDAASIPPKCHHAIVEEQLRRSVRNGTMGARLILD